jgi:hypothetical protein
VSDKYELQWTSEPPFNTKAFRKALKQVHRDRNSEAHYISHKSCDVRNNDTDEIVYDKLVLMCEFLKKVPGGIQLAFEKYHKGFINKMVLQLEALIAKRPAHLPLPTEEQREDYEDWFVGTQLFFS